MSKIKSSFLDSYDLTISTLSPVHIGCGEDYEPTNYVMQDSCLYHFDLTAAVSVFNEQDISELNSINQDRDPVLRLQQFILKKSNELAGVAHSLRPVSAELYKKYTKALGRAVSVEKSGRKVTNALEIARTAFNPHSQEPLIPGSSLKGALRTAVLDALNKGESTRHKGKEASKRLEEELLGGGFATDPMRLIKVGDARFIHSESTLLPRICFENNIKRRPPKDGKSTSLLSIMREVLPEFNYGAFEGQLSVQDLQGVRTDKTPKLQFTVQQLIQVCNRFYVPIFEREQKRFRSRGCLDAVWDKHANEVLGLLEPFITADAGALLRIGRHSGAESITLDGVRKVKILQGKDSAPRYQDTVTTDWLAGDAEKAEQNLLPFGWVFIDFNAPELQTQREKLETFLKQIAQPALQQQQKLFDQIKVKQEQAELAAQKLAEQERKYQAQLAAEKLKEEQRQKALAEMSEEQRQIETLKERSVLGEGLNQGSGSALIADLSALCDQAANWPENYKQELHSAALKLCKHAGINVKKNKNWRARLKELKGDT